MTLKLLLLFFLISRFCYSQSETVLYEEIKINCSPSIEKTYIILNQAEFESYFGEYRYNKCIIPDIDFANLSLIGFHAKTGGCGCPTTEKQF